MSIFYGLVQIASAVSGNLTRKFVGRGYICVDGVYYYARQNDNSRSIQTIAKDFKASLSDSAYASLSESIKTALENI